MNIFIVGGTFNHNQGKPSSIIEKIYYTFNSQFTEDNITLLNGNNINTLKIHLQQFFDVIFWAPNISNDEEKIIPNIKTQHPKTLLISSKRVVEKQYTEFDIIGRLLKTKSNLGVMITKPNHHYHFTLLDPLGNCYSSTQNINEMTLALCQRIKTLKQLNRISSECIGPVQNFTINPEFIKFIQHSANEFTHYVNAINPNRMLGNASTRCMFGFPAQKEKERIFVTQRNIDKALIKTEGFVEVTKNESTVQYYGNKKPSVDTPIQIRLFNFYKNINYMIHGHVYIEGAPFTHDKIPCGFIEEYNDIIQLFPNNSIEHFAINLKGHGCLIMSKSVDNLWHYANFKSRYFPEF